MKRLLTIILGFTITVSSAWAQINMSATSGVELVLNDADAISYYRQRDVNDNVCAIIKVVPDNELSGKLVMQTKGGMVPVTPPRGLSNYREDTGEWWFWISPTVTNIMLSCQGYTPTEWIGVSLQPGKVYRLNLAVESKVKFIKEYAGSGRVTFKMEINPKDVLVSYGESEDQISNSVEVNDGHFDTFLPEGKLFFMVENKYYQTYAEIIEVKRGMDEVKISLNPSFNTIKVNTDPQGADVYLDGELLGQTPLNPSGKISKGEHTLQFKKTDYYIGRMSFVAAGDGSTISLSTKTLKPQFGNVTLICEDKDAELVVTEDPGGKEIFRGKSGSKVQLNSDLAYKVESSRMSHVSQSTGFSGKTIEGKEVEITVDSPVPLYGELQLSSSPTRADVYIDGRKVGTTIYAERLLIGKHNVELRLEGYKTLIFTVDIPQDKTISISKELKQYREEGGVLESVKDWGASSFDPSSAETETLFSVVAGYDPIFNKGTVGVFIGGVKEFGGYFKYRRDFNDPKTFYDADAGLKYNISEASSTSVMTFQPDKDIQVRWVATAGGLWRLLQNIYIYGGLGWGVMDNYWMDTGGHSITETDGKYVWIEDLSRRGITIEVGGILRYKNYIATLGVADTNGYVDAEIGFGLVF